MTQVTSESRVTRWLDRHPLVVPLVAGAGFLGLFQTAVQLWMIQSMGGKGLATAFGVARFALIVGLLTVLLLTPAIMLIRRLLPAWRNGDRHRASWSACFAVVAALVGWMLADLWVAGPWVPDAFEPWVELFAALVFAMASLWVQPPRRWLQIAALATPLILLVSFLPIGEGYGSMSGETEPPTGFVPDADQPDVVLISIDTLRADRLGVYGRSPSLTPEIDRLANEGVVFERALAASPWTIPSVASMLTGLPTLRHGAGWPLGSGPTYDRSPLDEDLVTLAEHFAVGGYRTGAIVANGFLAPWTGMAQGFEEFDNPFLMASLSGFMGQLPLTRLIVNLTPAEAWGDYRAQGVTDQALAWLALEDPAPLFLWAHYIDPHSPFQSNPAVLDHDALIEMADQKQPAELDDGTVVGDSFVATDLVRSGAVWLGPKDRERIEEYYDRAVRYTDEHIGRLLAALRERSSDRPLVVALTSDHGEEFWDHGHFEHGHDYFREVTQIPLLLWSPDLVPSGHTISELVGLLDIAPTLLDLAGLPVPEPQAIDEGRSLASLWQTEVSVEDRQTPPRFSEGNLYNLPAVLVEDGPWRYVLRANDREELYDLTRDPEERFNVALQFPEVSARYRQLVEPRLAAYLDDSPREDRRELSPEELRALQALGYVD